MPADEPTILATSGGVIPGVRTRWQIGPLTSYAVDLAGISGRSPRVCFLGTAMGDDSSLIRAFYDAAQLAGWQASHLALFPMPNVDDASEHLLRQDVIWVFGGSVAGLLAMWRLHCLDEALRQAWQAGVVLTGVSAGSICWHAGGTTDSFGPELRVINNGLAFVSYSNAVHYDSEPQRRPMFQSLIAGGELPSGYATDDGAGLLYRGQTMVGAFAEKDGAQAYFVEPDGAGSVVETVLPITRL